VIISLRCWPSTTSTTSTSTSTSPPPPPPPPTATKPTPAPPAPAPMAHQSLGAPALIGFNESDMLDIARPVPKDMLVRRGLIRKNRVVRQEQREFVHSDSIFFLSHYCWQALRINSILILKQDPDRHLLLYPLCAARSRCSRSAGSPRLRGASPTRWRPAPVCLLLRWASFSFGGFCLCLRLCCVQLCGSLRRR
jgi:hypothetical protein